VATARGPLEEAQLKRFLETNKPWCGIFGDDAFTAANVELFSSLGGKFISKYGIGIDKFDIPAITRLGICLTNTRGSNHRAVAEMSLGLMLAGLRRIVEQSVHISEERTWVRLTGSELTGKTVLLIGFGRVGQQFALSLICSGANVLIYEPFFTQDHLKFVNKLADLASELNVEFAGPACRIGTVSQIDDALPLADLISLHAALNNQTKGLISEARIALMKPSVGIVNTARGGLVDEHAIAAGLKTGKIGFYAADVLHTESANLDAPFLGLPNAIVTGHTGSRTHDAVQVQGLMAVENLRLAFDGGNALYIVPPGCSATESNG
jgi:lactate dehydrogenase-like 2-hydroxyacid dehydrogenase